MKPSAAEKLLKAKPGAVKRLGAKVFLQVPLYKAKRQYKVAYVNLPLFRRLFASRVPQEKAAAIVQQLFNTTIEKERSTGEQVGTAWCDRQFDPLGLSLSGNLGSGRAYYIGKCFNIKGEKTPLATSEQRRFSDGLLEMERAIWETTVANALQGSISTGLNNVLAILDMDEECSVIWRDQPVRRAKIIRIDEAGELDRITHLFFAKKPLRKKALLDTAKAYGVLEADKFAERILHGSWSPGNISLRGHLIDFDTVCALKGRTPQYSFTRWHYQNHFGFEIHGQLEVLRAMVNDKKINKDKVTFEAMEDAAFTALQERLTLRFFTLMGFRDDVKTIRKYQTELQELTDLWSELSRKTFKVPRGFSVKDASSVSLHVFDFSAFFRRYPLLQRRGAFDPGEGVRLLCGNAFQAEEEGETLTLPVQFEFRDKLYGMIGEHFVTTPEDMQMLQIAALRFVKKYDALHRKIIAETKAKPREVEARAYVLNEDRAYMFPAFTPSFCIAQSQPPLSPQAMQGLVEATIRASRREPGAPFITDVHIYREGCAYRLLDGKGGFKDGFHFFEKPEAATGWMAGRAGRHKVTRNARTGDLLTARRDALDLLQSPVATTEAALTLHPKKGNKKKALRNILAS